MLFATSPRLAQLVLSGEGNRLNGEENGGEEGRKVGDHWPGEGESDAESVDSEGEDGLKHAGVYTGEEVRVLATLFTGVCVTINHCAGDEDDAGQVDPIAKVVHRAVWKTSAQAAGEQEKLPCSGGKLLPF